MRLLVLGSDGRAHALVWKLFNSPQVREVLCGPGNGGTMQLAARVAFPTVSAAEIGRWAFEEGIDLIVPADSALLYDGMVDEVISYHIGVVGAPQRSTIVEHSRCYAKELLLGASVPSARGRPCAELDTAERYLATLPMPVIVKADHPDGGEQVFVDRYAALQGLRDLMASGGGVVIEECLAGPRVIFSVLTDGRTALPLLPVRLYDRLGPQPESPYAPGIGAVSTSSVYAQRLGAYLLTTCIQPIMTALAREDLPFWGFLGVDCIITPQGPRVTAIRCSLHDLEAQVLLPRLEDDLVPLLQGAIGRWLHDLPPPRWQAQASVGLGLFHQGYPYGVSGGLVDGLQDLDAGVLAFHSHTDSSFGLRHAPRGSRPDLGGVMAGMLSNLIMGSGKAAGDGLHSTGGHVLTIVATGESLAAARALALANAARVRFPGVSWRADVGEHEYA